MIKITKLKPPPQVLIREGTAKRALHCNDYLADKTAYDTGKRKFTFDATIYGHKTVKKALIEAQYGKCCFCERKTGEDGDVEHFRPKAGCRQRSSDPLLRPGYYWLAYDWENLFLSCSACNQRHKRSLFPLFTDKRALSHDEDTTLETPLFIDPAQEDPEQYLSFRKEIPFAIDGNPQGKATIKALGLNREILNEVRRTRLNHLIYLRDIVREEANLSTDAGKQLITDAKRLLAFAVTDAGEFAGMARAAAKEDFDFSLP